MKCNNEKSERDNININNNHNNNNKGSVEDERK